MTDQQQPAEPMSRAMSEQELKSNAKLAAELFQIGWHAGWKEFEEQSRATIATLTAERDALRARVAELEPKVVRMRSAEETPAPALVCDRCDQRTAITLSGLCAACYHTEVPSPETAP